MASGTNIICEKKDADFSMNWKCY